MTGSIGVLMEVGSAKKLMDKVGVHLETIKSGRFKDTGSIAHNPRAFLGRRFTPFRLSLGGAVGQLGGQFRCPSAGRS